MQRNILLQNNEQSSTQMCNKISKTTRTARDPVNLPTVNLTLVRQYTDGAIVYVHHVLGLVGYIEPKALPDHAMPCRTELFVHGSFY